MGAALDGLKILDFSTLLSGPLASLKLVDQGAQVFKISAASQPDLVTTQAPLRIPY